MDSSSSNNEILFSLRGDGSQLGGEIDQLTGRLQGLNNIPLDQPFVALKKQLKEAVVEAQRLQAQFGNNSEEFRNAAQRVADLRDQIGDFNTTVSTFNPDNQLQGLVQVGQASVGAIGGVTAAMNLLGAETDDVESSILRLQSLSSLADSFGSIADLRDSFSNWNATLQQSSVFQKLNAAATTIASRAMQVLGVTTNTTSTGFKILKGAIAATGIGLIVIAVAALIQNFGSLKNAILGLIPGLSKVADFIGDIINAVTDFVGVTSEAERQTQQFIESTEQYIANSNRFLEANADKYDEYTNRKFAANIKYKQQLVDLAKDEKLTDEQKLAWKKQYEDSYNRAVAKADEDRAAKAKADSDKAKEQQKKDQDEREQKYKEHQQKLAQATKERIEKEKAYQANIIEQDKITSKLIEDARLAAIKDEFTQKQLSLAVQEQNELDSQIENLNKKLINEETYQIRKKAIEDRYIQLQADLLAEKTKEDTSVRNETIVNRTIRINTILEGDTPEQALSKIQNIYDAKLSAENSNYEQEKLSKAGNSAALEKAEEQHQANLTQILNDAVTARQEIKQKELDTNVTVTTTNVIQTTREQKIDETDTPDVAREKVAAVLAAKLEAEDAAYLAEKEKKQGNAAELELLEQQHQTNLTNLQDEATEARKKIDEKELAAKRATVGAFGNLLGQAAELAGKQTVAGKALAVASTTIQTYQSATSAFAGMTSQIPGPVGIALGVAAAAFAVASGIANIKKILSVKVPGKGSGGAGSAPSEASFAGAAPVINAAAVQQQQTQDVRVVNNPKQEPIKAYITNSDLQNNEQKNKFLNQVSTF